MASFVKDLFSVGISKFAIIFFGLAQSIITARWLGPEANGTIAALAVYPSLFITFGSLGISQSATHFMGKDKYSEDCIKTSIAQIWLFSTFVSVIISFLLIRYFSNSGENLLLVLLAIGPIPFSLFNTYNSGIFLGKNQIGTYNKINWLPTGVAFMFVLLLVVLIPMGIKGAMLAIVTGPAFMFVLLLFKNDFISAFQLQVSWEAIRSLLMLGIVYATAMLVINLNYKADVILLDKFSSPFELGIYSKGVSITQYLWQIPMLFSTIVFARSANAKDGYNYSRKVAQLLRISVVGIGLGSLGLVLLAKHIILIMYGVEFVKSIEVLQFLLPGVLLLTIFKVLNMDLAGKGKPWVSMKAMIPALLLNVILNIILIPDYGANGAAVSSTISYTLAALLFLHFYSKETKLSVKDIVTYSKTDFQPIIAVLYKTLKKGLK